MIVPPVGYDVKVWTLGIEARPLTSTWIQNPSPQVPTSRDPATSNLSPQAIAALNPARSANSGVETAPANSDGPRLEPATPIIRAVEAFIGDRTYLMVQAPITGSGNSAAGGGSSRNLP